MRRMMSMLLLIVGVVGLNGNIINAENMEQQSKLKMYVKDPGGS
ncbi:hypothetical protein [Bacillus cereus group sp. IBL03679]